MWKMKGAYPEIVRGMGNYSRTFFELMLPPVDIYEISGSLVVVADLAGFSKDQIAVKASAHSITISAKRERDQDVDSFHVSQRPIRIRKTIPLPVEIDESVEPSAKYDNGVLTVKLAAKGFRQIKVE